MGVESTTVILSAAIVYIDATKANTWESLYSDALFVKFSVKDQIENYGRTVDKDTIAWWNKQCDLVKQQSFFPKKDDLPAEQGIEILRNYINQHCNPENTLIFTRGSLDQMSIDSLCKAVGVDLLVRYSNYRDMRTYVDLVATNPKRGYCDIDASKYPGIWDRNVVIKHNPVDDIVLDALQLLYPE
jgi:hypothetical protein